MIMLLKLVLLLCIVCYTECSDSLCLGTITQDDIDSAKLIIRSSKLPEGCYYCASEDCSKIVVGTRKYVSRPSNSQSKEDIASHLENIKKENEKETETTKVNIQSNKKKKKKDTINPEDEPDTITEKTTLEDTVSDDEINMEAETSAVFSSSTDKENKTETLDLTNETINATAETEENSEPSIANLFKTMIVPSETFPYFSINTQNVDRKTVIKSVAMTSVPLIGLAGLGTIAGALMLSKDDGYVEFSLSPERRQFVYPELPMQGLNYPYVYDFSEKRSGRQHSKDKTHKNINQMKKYEALRKILYTYPSSSQYKKKIKQ